MLCTYTGLQTRLVGGGTAELWCLIIRAPSMFVCWLYVILCVSKSQEAASHLSLTISFGLITQHRLDTVPRSSQSSMTGRGDIFCGRFGTSFEAKRWLSLDPCGLFCITCSLSIHVFALAVIALFLIQHSVVSRSIFYAVYCPAAFMALWSLHTAWTTNPGAVPFGARPLTTVKRAGGVQKSRSIRRCAKCNDNYKPPRAHHDSVTGRCIVKMDHYWYVCDWLLMPREVVRTWPGSEYCLTMISVFAINAIYPAHGYATLLVPSTTSSLFFLLATPFWRPCFHWP